MKTINEQIFAILNKKFPGEFIYRVDDHHIVTSQDPNAFFVKWNPFENIEDAFWVAEKLGLFSGKNFVVLFKFKPDWVIESINDNRDFIHIARGATVQEVICKAIIEVFGDDTT